MAIPILKAAVVWLLILVCAVLNGLFREVVLVPRFGTPAALAFSAVLLCALILVVSLIFVRWLGSLDTWQSLRVGLLWLLLTLAFEFGFGRLAQHREWSELLGAYTFEDGNLWPLVLVVTFFAPLLAVRVRAWVEKRE